MCVLIRKVFECPILKQDNPDEMFRLKKISTIMESMKNTEAEVQIAKDLTTVILDEGESELEQLYHAENDPTIRDFNSATKREKLR